MGFQPNDLDLIEAGTVHTKKSFWTRHLKRRFLSPFILFLIVLKVIMLYPGHTSNAMKSNTFHTHTQFIDGEGKRKSKLYNNERFYFTFNSYAANFYCHLWRQENMYYLHNGNKMIQQKKEKKTKLDLWRQLISPSP